MMLISHYGYTWCNKDKKKQMCKRKLSHDLKKTIVYIGLWNCDLGEMKWNKRVDSARNGIIKCY